MTQQKELAKNDTLSEKWQQIKVFKSMVTCSLPDAPNLLFRRVSHISLNVSQWTEAQA